MKSIRGSAARTCPGSASERRMRICQRAFMNRLHLYRKSPPPANGFPTSFRDRKLSLFDTSVGVVVVDALEILGFHPVPGHVRMGIEFDHDIADEVFDEDGVFVGAFGD